MQELWAKVRDSISLQTLRGKITKTWSDNVVKNKPSAYYSFLDIDQASCAGKLVAM